VKKCYLSVEGKKKLEKQKRELVEKQKKISKSVGSSRLKSDSCNNSFINGSRELQRIKRKIEDINEVLNDAEVIDVEELDTAEVCPGCEVIICFPAGETQKYVVGLDDPGVHSISLNAPLGKKIIGRKEGEIVEYEVRGEVKEVMIKNII